MQPDLVEVSKVACSEFLISAALGKGTWGV